jgi:hypothetical protein
VALQFRGAVGELTRAYRAWPAGNVTGIPSGATVTGAVLTMHAARFYGGNPFASGCGIQVDMVSCGSRVLCMHMDCESPHPHSRRCALTLGLQSPAFNGNPILEVSDLTAKAEVLKAASLVRTTERAPSINLAAQAHQAR